MLRLQSQRAALGSRLLVTAALILALVPVEPRTIAADEIILAPTPFLRKFPQQVWCPLPIEMEFTSSGSTATIFVTANTYVFDATRDPMMVYTHQGIDDIAVVRDSIHALLAFTYTNNVGPFQECFLEAQVPTIFKFDQLTPGDAPLLELFEGTPSPAWDLSNDAYLENGRSALNTFPVSPDDPVNFGSHCLGLGHANASPSLADSARTQVTIGGLFAGKHYFLTGWWSVDDGIITGDVNLTIKITGPDQTPLAQKSWGALKARYR